MKTQYRAMFVENCRVDAGSRVFCPSAPAKRAAKRAKRAIKVPSLSHWIDNLCVIDLGGRDRRGHGRAQAQHRHQRQRAHPAPLPGRARFGTSMISKGAVMQADDFFHPVYCQVCATQVGFCDEDELYHFNNVLSSYS